ncbi:MAG TPA: lipid-binding SYLF domain-containing protein [Bryobacteraceae bacterium]|nr:lipid-binding SYLF domain-containing protein [Bryobacteraceae bacterium]
MHNSTFTLHKIRTANIVLVLAIAAAGIRPAAAENMPKRVEKAVSVLNTLTGSSARGVRPEQFASADCVAVIPGYKKGAAVVGVGFGRGFISCRKGDTWSAPAAVTLEGGSLGVQVGGEKIDIVILSLDKEQRSKLLSNRFTIGTGASAAWENGKSAHEDPNAKILFFGHTGGAFAGFDLDGTTLKPDDSRNKALYGKVTSNSEIVESAATPATAQPLVSKLTSLIRAESASTSARLRSRK